MKAKEKTELDGNLYWSSTEKCENSVYGVKLRNAHTGYKGFSNTYYKHGDFNVRAVAAF